MRLWWHRDTLVEVLRTDISRSGDLGPDWPEVVSDAVYRQDMEWVLLLGEDDVEPGVRVVRPRSLEGSPLR